MKLSLSVSLGVLSQSSFEGVLSGAPVDVATLTLRNSVFPDTGGTTVSRIEESTDELTWITATETNTHVAEEGLYYRGFESYTDDDGTTTNISNVIGPIAAATDPAFPSLAYSAGFSNGF